MYQQNPYQQQGFGGQLQNQQANPSQSFNANQQINQGQQSVLQEQDLANVVLNELKRVAREYTTAVLEANNLETRQTFQFLLQKALHDQAILYQQIQQVNGYGEIPIASQQDIQQELYNQSHSAPQLHAFVQQNQIGSLSAQSQQQSQMQNQPQNQGFAANQQAQGMGQQQAFQTSQIPSTSPLYPYGIYGQASVTYTGTQMPSQSSGYNVSQGMGQSQDAGMGTGTSTPVGMGTGPGAVGTGAAPGTGSMGMGTSSGAGTSSGMGPGAGLSQGTGTSTGIGSGTGMSGFASGHASPNQGHHTQSSSSVSHNHPSSGYYASSDTDQSEQKLVSSSETDNPKSIGRKASLNRNAGSKYSF